VRAPDDDTGVLLPRARVRRRAPCGTERAARPGYHDHGPGIHAERPARHGRRRGRAPRRRAPRPARPDRRRGRAPRDQRTRAAPTRGRRPPRRTTSSTGRWVATATPATTSLTLGRSAAAADHELGAWGRDAEIAPLDHDIDGEVIGYSIATGRRNRLPYPRLSRGSAKVGPPSRTSRTAPNGETNS